jgi:hypothetical protein
MTELLTIGTTTIKTGQKTTRLGVKKGLKFTIYDLRGKQGFPNTAEGLVFEYEEKRTIYCRYTGKPIKRNARYVIRTGGNPSSKGKGWRIDSLHSMAPAEAVYGENGQAYFSTPTEAAKGLRWALDEIKNNSSLGG